MKIDVSNGELLDKLTILEIKSSRITDPAKSNIIIEELSLIRIAASGIIAVCSVELDELKNINEALWDIEDRIRNFENNQDFGPDFIETARSVYKLNDIRAAIKKEINILTDSDLFEVKSYEQY